MRKRTRTYVKAARAESEAATRDRIVEALIALHEEVGPARTTVKAVAERAGVQRLTVYRHFPGEVDMIAACSARWAERFPAPDLTAMPEKGRARARAILLALYRYFRAGAPMLTRIHADAQHLELVRQHIASFAAYLEEVAEQVTRAWPGRSARRRATVRHAVQFATWQSLAAVTADDEDAVELVMRWCDAV